MSSLSSGAGMDQAEGAEEGVQFIVECPMTADEILFDPVPSSSDIEEDREVPVVLGDDREGGVRISREVAQGRVVVIIPQPIEVPDHQAQLLHEMNNQTHTILLIQTTTLPSRTFCDYNSVKDCMDGVCSIYEQHLRQLNPDLQLIVYNMEGLLEFLDQTSDMACMVFDNSRGTYVPFDKEWIKEKVYLFLRSQH